MPVHCKVFSAISPLERPESPVSQRTLGNYSRRLLVLTSRHPFFLNLFFPFFPFLPSHNHSLLPHDNIFCLAKRRLPSNQPILRILSTIAESPSPPPCSEVARPQRPSRLWARLAHSPPQPPPSPRERKKSCLCRKEIKPRLRPPHRMPRKFGIALLAASCCVFAWLLYIWGLRPAAAGIGGDDGRRLVLHGMAASKPSTRCQNVLNPVVLTDPEPSVPSPVPPSMPPPKAMSSPSSTPGKAKWTSPSSASRAAKSSTR